jgi:hypothetical protein
MITDDSNLEIFDLSNNGMSGALPDLSYHGNTLTSLKLNGNSFSGTMHAHYGQLLKLKTLFAQNNNLTGKLKFSTTKNLKTEKNKNFQIYLLQRIFFFSREAPSGQNVFKIRIFF